MLCCLLQCVKFFSITASETENKNVICCHQLWLNVCHIARLHVFINQKSKGSLFPNWGLIQGLFGPELSDSPFGHVSFIVTQHSVGMHFPQTFTCHAYCFKHGVKCMQPMLGWTGVHPCNKQMFANVAHKYIFRNMHCCVMRQTETVKSLILPSDINTL